MVARQTVIRVRSDQVSLSAAVGAVVRPEDLARGREDAARLLRTRSDGTVSQTTFCPLCLGPKTLRATRCAKCRNAAMSRYASQARNAGRRSDGHRGAARGLISDAPRTADIGTDLSDMTAPTHDRRIRGDMQVRKPQPWVRRVLIDGVWVPEPTDPGDA